MRRAGRWDEALACAAPADRAEILVDRHWWQLDDPAEAHEAVAELASSDPVRSGYLDAQLRYVRLLFARSPQADDASRARNAFAAATADLRLAGWATFWLGVLAENIDRKSDEATVAYHRAQDRAVAQGDALLESYTARHIGAHLLKERRDEGLRLLRRSYHLRATLGARPQTAAAALALALELRVGPEADQLRETASLTARDLRLTWLLDALSPCPPPA
ncbi:hypothetical protein BG844_02615 [Couchioplanes caeruleus subsp. caeruleus]|uniref:Uncharacterized protein n=1 Tax=Couchioplanes caeruleus subsp. caeruleus TaxID=56427 RepID=A0A1K0GTJ6_9ACTN|nr:hypothetical protein BG844_02615 [Couchioplanes caeruleus subsp. caeruleus]